MTKTSKTALAKVSMRHISLFGTALLLNALLVIYISSMSTANGERRRDNTRAIPLRITETETPPPSPEPPPKERKREPQPKAVRLPLPVTVPLPPLQRIDTGALYTENSESALILPAPNYLTPLPEVPSGGISDSIALTREAEVIRPPNLSLYYPYRAIIKGITGETVLRLHIDAKGSVTKVETVSSVPENTFEKAALRVGRSLRFTPAQQSGKSVATVTSISLLWRLDQE